MPRLSSSQALLGSETFQKIRDTRILVVGAGGIGCELLKNLVLVGFAHIELIDLDTIDLSNLNRQFLFRKPDISKPKALVAASTARHFNPSSGIEIHARHGNIKEASNDVEWIKGFGLVMNALDNMDARRHVNRLCQAAGVPLIESGTAGYFGQVTPYIPNQTECFECTTKPTPKSFPVCTIRATPSEPIHCIVWGKSYLFNKVFGEDDEAGDSEELEKAKQAGENAEEIENLKKEAAAFREVRSALGEEDGPRRVFHKVFNEDINRLLAMDDMWNVPGRVRPVALDYEAIMEGTFIAPPVRTTATAPANGSANPPANSANTNGSTSGAVLRDQRELSTKDNLELFMDSCKRLAARSIAHPQIVLAFDKDDDDTLDFVLATANLRATAYGIATKTRFQVKEMAGNIIPAIATTNAIIAGLIVMQSISLLSSNLKQTHNVFLRSDAKKPLERYSLNKPEEGCSICRDVYVSLRVDVGKLTLGEFVEDIVGGWLARGLASQVNGNGNGHENGEANGEGEGEDEEGEKPEWAIYEGARVLADPDFDDNHHKTLAELGVERGKMLTVVDEDEKYRPIHFCICDLEPNSSSTYLLPQTPPQIPNKPPKPKELSTSPEPEIIEVHSSHSVPSKSESKSALYPESIDKEETLGKRGREEGLEGEGEGEGKRRKVAPPGEGGNEGGDSDFEIL